MQRLQEQMDIYIRGYFEKAENFRVYINIINRLDAETAYINNLKRLQQAAFVRARQCLWHKVQIQDHIRKSGYFENLMYSLDTVHMTSKSDYDERKLDITRDVIHNRLYWPQGKQEGIHG